MWEKTDTVQCMDTDFLIQEHKERDTMARVRKIRSQKTRKPLWREYLETAGIALVAAILLRIFVVSAHRVNSSSMEDTLFTGDYIFVNKLAYDYGRGPEAGDIIVFKYPNNPEKDYIKRIGALPGQTVQVADKVLYVDGQVASIPTESKNIDNRIIPGDLSFRDNFGPYEVPPGQYFVLGDNRDDSRDSRFWGCVPEENIRGKVLFIYWSWEPDPEAPGFDFPYIIDAFRWVGHVVWNLPTQVRWDRIGKPV